MIRHYLQSSAWLILVVSMLSSQPLYGEDPEPAQPAVKKDSGRLYTAWNLWFEKPEKMYCINYNRGTMIPAGTEVSANIHIEGSAEKPKIRFRTVKDKVEYVIYFNPKFHPGVSPDTFKERLFTNKPFEEFTKGFSEKEIEAVKKGGLVVGMSKRAVIVSRGRPAEHMTPSPYADDWYYWENRFRKKLIHFDEKGRTTKREQTDSDDL